MLFRSSSSSSATTMLSHTLESSNSFECTDILVKNANGDYAAAIPSVSLLMSDVNDMNNGDGADELDNEGWSFEPKMCAS